jgi:hypothetical protein
VRGKRGEARGERQVGRGKWGEARGEKEDVLNAAYHIARCP